MPQVELHMDVLPAHCSIYILALQGSAVLVMAEDAEGQPYEPVWCEMTEPGQLHLTWEGLTRVRTPGG